MCSFCTTGTSTILSVNFLCASCAVSTCIKISVALFPPDTNVRSILIRAHTHLHYPSQKQWLPGIRCLPLYFAFTSEDLASGCPRRHCIEIAISASIHLPVLRTISEGIHHRSDVERRRVCSDKTRNHHLVYMYARVNMTEQVIQQRDLEKYLSLLVHCVVGELHGNRFHAGPSARNGAECKDMV